MTAMSTTIRRPYAFRREGGGQSLTVSNKVVLALILICLYLNLPVYIFKLQNGLLPKYFYYGLVLLLAPMLFTRMRKISTYMTSPFVLWTMALLALQLLHLMSSSYALEHRINQLILTRVQNFIMVIIIGYAFSIIRASAYQWTFVLLAVVAPCVVTVDFLFPGTLYPMELEGAVIGRAGGTFINPNDASASLLLIFLLACPVVPKKYRLPLLLLCGVGVLVTFSRAAMMTWALLWIYLLVRRRIPAVGAMIMLAMIALPMAMGSMNSYLNTRSEFAGSIDNIEQRLAFFSNKRIDDESGQARMEVMEAGWETFLRNPVTGIGAGETSVGVTERWPYPVNTHNQLMALAAEYGVVGIILWCWLALMLLRGRFFEDYAMQIAAVLMFIFMTFFTHNMFDFPFWLITFSLLSQRTSRHGHAAPATIPSHVNSVPT
jgi:hypothetical protein